MASSNFPEEWFFPNKVTLFEQVSQSISRLISEGHWKPGEMLPNEAELAKSFNVSQGTMRRALKMLVENGVLVRRQGRGTFVAEFCANEQIVYKRYIRLQPDDPSTDELNPTRAKLICFERIPAPVNVAHLLQIDMGQEVVHAARTLSASSGLVTYDEIWGIGKDFEKMTAENLAHHREKLLYAFYQRELGISITKCEERIKAALLPAGLCSTFNLPYPQPVIEILRTAFTFDDRPIECHRQLSITNRYHYSIR